MVAKKNENQEVAFRPAGGTNRRLKLLLWGDTGTGKTTLSLQFPSPAVIDLEGGTEHYGGEFSFDVLKATTSQDITAAVNWLLANDHDYRTLVIDPITLFWDSLQRHWSDVFLRRNKGSKGHRLEYYDLQPRDWMTIKADHKEFIRKLIQLDMNVIVTARQKTLYADQGFMRAVGETFDGEKGLPYLFDTILRLYRDEKGRFMAENIKDRTNKFPPGHFEISYQILEDRLGSAALGRKAAPVLTQASDQMDTLRQLIAASGMDEATVQQRIESYGATSIESLTQEKTNQIIAKLKAAGIQTSATDPQVKEAENAEG